MKAAFSVIVPIYNAEKTLAETLNSIAAQTYPNFEVILINDGSTDTSGAIIKSWQDQNPELGISIITQENKGLGATRNKGIEQARHPWVALLDADDLWLPQKLEKAAVLLQAHNPDILFHAFTTFGANHNYTRKGHAVNTLEDLLTTGNPIMPSAVILKTTVALEFTFSSVQEIHGAEDLELWMRLLVYNKTFYHLDEPLTLYRQTGGMSTDIEQHLECVKNVLHQFYQSGEISTGLYEKALHRKNYEAARFYHKRKKFKKAAEYYKNAGSLKLPQILLRLLNKMRISV